MKEKKLNRTFTHEEKEIHHHERIMIKYRYTFLILEIIHQSTLTLLLELKEYQITNF